METNVTDYPFSLTLCFTIINTFQILTLTFCIWKWSQILEPTTVSAVRCPEVGAFAQIHSGAQQDACRTKRGDVLVTLQMGAFAQIHSSAQQDACRRKRGDVLVTRRLSTIALYKEQNTRGKEGQQISRKSL